MSSAYRKKRGKSFANDEREDKKVYLTYDTLYVDGKYVKL